MQNGYLLVCNLLLKALNCKVVSLSIRFCNEIIEIVELHKNTKIIVTINTSKYFTYLLSLSLFTICLHSSKMDQYSYSNVPTRVEI